MYYLIIVHQSCKSMICANYFVWQIVKIASLFDLFQGIHPKKITERNSNLLIEVTNKLNNFFGQIRTSRIFSRSIFEGNCSTENDYEDTLTNFN